MMNAVPNQDWYVHAPRVESTLHKVKSAGLTALGVRRFLAKSHSVRQQEVARVKSPSYVVVVVMTQQEQQALHADCVVMWVRAVSESVALRPACRADPATRL